MKIFILISALTLVSGQDWGTPVSQCAYYNGPLPTAVEIAGCSQPPCSLIIGDTTNFEILFRTPRDLSSLTTRVTFFILGIPLHYPLGSASDTCSNLLSGRCPAAQGALLLYRLSLFLDSAAPVDLGLPMEIRILDENDEPVVCFRLNINTVDQGQKLRAINAPKPE